MPAFRLDPRCEVVALAGSDAARTQASANDAGIARSFGDWRELVDSDTVDLVAIAVPPRLQPEIAVRRFSAASRCSSRSRWQADWTPPRRSCRPQGTRRQSIDFNFTEVPAWQQAKAMLDAGAIGRLRHVAVTWQVENVSTRLRLKNWKTSADEGGGALGNLASHSLHYLEWFCGPVSGLSARLSGLPDDPAFETGVTMALAFASGASGSLRHELRRLSRHRATGWSSTARTARWCWPTRLPTTCAASPCTTPGGLVN